MTKSRIIRWAIIIISLFFIVSTTKSIIELWGAGDKLTTREKNLANLRKERENLLRLKAKVDSNDYLEHVARDQLGLSKPGEQLIIIPKELLADNSPIASPDATPNWQKWAKLLF